MHQLLKRIRAAAMAQKCALMEESDFALHELIEKLEEDLSKNPQITDFPLMDQKINQAELLLVEMEQLFCKLNDREREKLVEKLLQQYAKSREVLEKFLLIDKNGICHGDYEEFLGVDFKFPTFEEVCARFSNRDLKGFLSMEENGLRPRLTITPLALKIATIGTCLLANIQNVDHRLSKKKGLSLQFFSDEKKLVYQPENVHFDNKQDALVFSEGLNKSEFIKKYRGWLISFVATCPEAVIVEDRSFGGIADFLIKNRQQFQESGRSGLGIEDYLVSQMDVYNRTGKFFDSIEAGRGFSAKKSIGKNSPQTCISEVFVNNGWHVFSAEVKFDKKQYDLSIDEFLGPLSDEHLSEEGIALRRMSIRSSIRGKFSLKD